MGCTETKRTVFTVQLYEYPIQAIWELKQKWFPFWRDRCWSKNVPTLAPCFAMHAKVSFPLCKPHSRFPSREHWTAYLQGHHSLLFCFLCFYLGWLTLENLLTNHQNPGHNSMKLQGMLVSPVLKPRKSAFCCCFLSQFSMVPVPSFSERKFKFHGNTSSFSLHSGSQGCYHSTYFSFNTNKSQFLWLIITLPNLIACSQEVNPKSGMR